MMRHILTLAALLAVSTASASQLGIYTFTGAAGNEATFPVDAQPANGTFSVMSRGSGVTPSSASGTFSASAWSTAALDANDYYEFSITPAGGFAATLTNLTFSERRSSTGIRDISVRSSLDSYAADVATFNVPDDDLTRSQTVPLGSAFANQSGTVTFRLYGYNAEGGGGTWRIDNVALFGSISSAGPPPTNVQFTASSDSIGEAGGAYTVTVYKTLASGNVSGSVTLGGAAATPGDYTIDTTNFTMNGATTSATFVVTINDDGDTESAETVTLTLTGVTGGTIASPSVFTLTITDNDGAPSSCDIFEADFESGALTGWTQDVPGNWAASTVSPISGSYSLKHNLSSVAGTNYIYATPNYDVTAGSTTWRFQMKNGNWDPSTANRFWVYLMSDSNMLVDGSPNGYAVGVFNASSLFDTVALVRVTGGAVASTIAASGVNWGSAQTVGIEVSRSAAGDWELKTDANGGFDSLVSAGTAADATHTDSSYFGAYFQFTSTRAGDFWIDDICISGTSSTPTTNVKFSASAAAISEAVGTYTVTVHKTLAEGNVSGSVTLGGTAASPGDYTIDTTSFTLNGATTSATFNITIVDDGSTESAETVILTLANVTGGTIVSPSVFTLTINDNDVPPPPSFNVWVNELHYDNTGVNGDVNEGVEIAGPAGTDLMGYSVHYYDGNPAGSGVYYVTNLWGIIPDQSNGFGTLWFGFSETGIVQNGSADGLALVYGSTQVIQLLSYEGTFTATNGPAAGLMSTDIGVEQPSSTPEDWSLQLCGDGTNYAAFAWSTNLPHSRGLLNPCQTIPGGGSGYTPEQEGYIVVHWGSVGGYTGDGADDDGDGFGNVDEFIAGTIPVPPSGSNSFFVGTALTNGASRFVVFPTQTGRLYRLWSTPALFPTQTWSVVAGPTAGTGGNLSLTDGVNTNLGVYRLSVELD